MLNLLQELCELSGVSGNEHAVRRFILSHIEQCRFVDECHVDPLGNILVHVKGSHKASNTVMFAAHMDEVGVIITGVTDDGYLRFDTVGGIDTAVLFGHRVIFGDICGVIGGKAIHMCRGDEKKNIPEKGLLIDIGVSSREAALELVNIGDVGVFDSEFRKVGQLVKGRAIDDRAGCAVLLKLLKSQPAYDFWLAFTVQEEVGLRGAKTAAFTIDPDIAVVVDATTAADTVGVSPDKQVCRVHSGAVVSFMDRRTLYDKALYDLIMETANENGLRAQPKSMVAGGNDAGAIQTSKNGVRVAAISVPCRYIHSPSCVAAIEDVEHIALLLEALIERLCV